MALAKIRNWYGKYETPISSAFLIAGFTVDVLTLRIVNLFWETVWTGANLTIVGICILLVHFIEKGEGDEANTAKVHFWLVNILQFFFGSLLSTFMVLYFNSSDFFSSWPFLLLLAIFFWANEALKRNFVRLSFQVAQFFFSIFAFAIYLLPLLFHKMSDVIFLFSGLTSLLFIAFFLWIIKKTSGGQFSESRLIIYGLVFLIYAVVNVFYFTNLIPPIPLSLKDAGAYHSVQRNSKGDYDLTSEDIGFKKYFAMYPDFNLVIGKPVYVYTAIFSPPNLDIKVFHEWQYRDETAKEWKTVDIITLNVVGGREGGFRTYSKKTANIQPGHWRVNVLNERGQRIGQVRFNIVLVKDVPDTVIKIGE